MPCAFHDHLIGVNSAHVTPRDERTHHSTSTQTKASKRNALSGSKPVNVLLLVPGGYQKKNQRVATRNRLENCRTKTQFSRLLCCMSRPLVPRLLIGEDRERSSQPAALQRNERPVRRSLPSPPIPADNPPTENALEDTTFPEKTAQKPEKKRNPRRRGRPKRRPWTGDTPALILSRRLSLVKHVTSDEPVGGTPNRQLDFGSPDKRAPRKRRGSLLHQSTLQFNETVRF